MSMTQIAFFRKDDLPVNGQIQAAIQQLGYDFKILSGLEKRIDEDGLMCSINGQQAYFETYTDTTTNVLSEYEAGWISEDLSDLDTAIAFVWGADFAAGACIGLICIALIDGCHAQVYYMDDQVKYSREMLVADTPLFLAELNKQKNNIPKQPRVKQQEIKPLEQKQPEPKSSFWNRLKKLFD